MRRSAAPSQQGPATKKPCFVPPVASQPKQPDVLSKCDDRSTASASVANISRSVCDVVHIKKNGARDSINCPPASIVGESEFQVPQTEPIADVAAANHVESTFPIPTGSQLGILNGQNSLRNGTQRFKSRPQLFEAIQPSSAAVVDRDILHIQLPIDSTGSALCSDHVPAKYFSVMWCKVSKKKHKKWEGDAVLIARQRSVTLVDMEGKEIGRSTGYKTSELEALTDGQMLVIGGKEIEVMGVLTEEQFTSGKCFQSASSSSCNSLVVGDDATISHPVPVTVSKLFVRPFKTGDAGSSMHFAKVKVPIQPYFNPSAPNALVMPRPTDSHQWQHNPNGIQVVDVVVDPHVAIHLRPHQRQGVIFLYQCVLGMRPHQGCGAILADEMGLGKTLQCIALIWTLYKQGPYGGRPIVKRALILTPGSLVKNWFKEFRKWLSSERLSVFAVSADNSVDKALWDGMFAEPLLPLGLPREFAKLPRFPVMIISYEMFIRNIETISKIHFDLLICDEGHRLKNANIKTAVFASSLSVSRRVILTGTPVQNDLQELHALADFCNPGILGTLSAFRRVYEEPIIASRQPTASVDDQELGRARASELGLITDSFIIRRTQEINNQYLPPRVDVVLFCALSELQLKLYRALIKSRAVLACLRDSDTAQHLRCISALRKLCNHPHLLFEKAAEACVDIMSAVPEADLYRGLHSIYPQNYNLDSQIMEYSGKMKVLESLLNRFSILSPVEKVVLVSNYTSTLDLIEKLCKGYGFPLLRLDGQTPTSRRMEIVERFNSRTSPEFIFLLSTKAGGMGLNLIGASRLVLYDIDWNPANDLQAMARVWRDGQRRRCYVYRLLSTGTIEEKIYQRQVAKQGLSGAVVDADFSRSPALDVEQLRELFTLDELTQCSTHQLINCDCMSSVMEGDDQSGRIPADGASDTRQCQLGKSTSNLEKNTGMDELLEWTHVAGSCPDLAALDPALEASTLGTVTFAMWTKSNSFNMENGNLLKSGTHNLQTNLSTAKS